MSPPPLRKAAGTTWSTSPAQEPPTATMAAIVQKKPNPGTRRDTSLGRENPRKKGTLAHHSSQRHRTPSWRKTVTGDVRNMTQSKDEPYLTERDDNTTTHPPPIPHPYPRLHTGLGPNAHTPPLRIPPPATNGHQNSRGRRIAN